MQLESFEVEEVVGRVEVSANIELGLVPNARLRIVAESHQIGPNSGRSSDMRSSFESVDG
jgi:hypothetical protein